MSQCMKRITDSETIFLFLLLLLLNDPSLSSAAVGFFSSSEEALEEEFEADPSESDMFLIVNEMEVKNCYK